MVQVVPLFFTVIIFAGWLAWPSPHFTIFIRIWAAAWAAWGVAAEENCTRFEWLWGVLRKVRKFYFQYDGDFQITDILDRGLTLSCMRLRHFMCAIPPLSSLRVIKKIEILFEPVHPCLVTLMMPVRQLPRQRPCMPLTDGYEKFLIYEDRWQCQELNSTPNFVTGFSTKI